MATVGLVLHDSELRVAPRISTDTILRSNVLVRFQSVESFEGVGFVVLIAPNCLFVWDVEVSSWHPRHFWASDFVLHRFPIMQRPAPLPFTTKLFSPSSVRNIRSQCEVLPFFVKFFPMWASVQSVRQRWPAREATERAAPLLTPAEHTPIGKG